MMNTRQRRSQRRSLGLAAVEFAMVLPILLILLFGVVDFGRIVLVRQVMINLSREAANLASRGTPLTDVVNAIQLSAAPLNLSQNGYLVVTQVERDNNGNVRITDQQAFGGQTRGSHVGVGIGNLATLPVTNTPVPLPGQNMFVAEVFYHSPSITPLGRLVDISLSEEFYDAAFF